jgi:hypothetical protein
MLIFTANLCGKVCGKFAKDVVLLKITYFCKKV